MQLLDDEETLYSANSGNITLTNYRLRVTTQKDTRLIQSVLLRQIIFCSFEFKNHWWVVILAVLCFLAAFFRPLPQLLSAGCFFMALLLAAIYVNTRRTTIRITTAGEPIEVAAPGKSIAFATELIDAIESAIINRIALDEVIEIKNKIVVPPAEPVAAQPVYPQHLFPNVPA